MTMFYFLFLGGVSLLLFLNFEILSTALALFLTIWVVILALTLISDFTDVLIDVRDNFILMPRPVNARILAVSRLLYIMIYLLRLLISFILPGLLIYESQGKFCLEIGMFP